MLQNLWPFWKYKYHFRMVPKFWDTRKSVSGSFLPASPLLLPKNGNCLHLTFTCDTCVGIWLPWWPMFRIRPCGGLSIMYIKVHSLIHKIFLKNKKLLHICKLITLFYVCVTSVENNRLGIVYIFFIFQNYNPFSILWLLFTIRFFPSHPFSHVVTHVKRWKV